MFEQGILYFHFTASLRNYASKYACEKAGAPHHASSSGVGKTEAEDSVVGPCQPHLPAGK